MRKKNGFLLTELLITFSLSFIILLVIFNTTISLNQRLSDLFVENKAYSQQIVFNRKIANDMSFFKISDISESISDNIRTLNITYSNGMDKVLKIDSSDNASVTYDDEKILLDSKNMKIKNQRAVTCININGKYLVRLKVPIYYIRETNDYGIELYGIADNDVCPDSVEGELAPSFVDITSANEPVLADGMIPVVYNETDDVWVRADTEAGWYAYQDQVWANAVTTTSTNRARYLSDSHIGQEIPMTDINSMWVWIPRYRYNIPSNLGSSSAVTSPPQINVVFEPNDKTNGVTETVYRNGISAGVANSLYYTHPAFRNGSTVYNEKVYDNGGWDKELTGFWVGKFKVGTTNTTCIDGNSENNCINVEPIVKPNTKILTRQTTKTRFITSLKFAGGDWNENTGDITFSGNPTYGLTSSTNTHMLKNTEWGAVAYLSQSKYGKMGNENYTGTNKEIYQNKSNPYITGQSDGKPNGNTSSTQCTYNDITNRGNGSGACGAGASTTGTIYGIYDMSGGSNEYVMGNWNNTVLYSSFTNGKFPNKKYYDLYKGNDSNDITIEKSILGDATWETMKWYSDHSAIVKTGAPWFTRGGYSEDNNTAGIFHFASYYGGSNDAWRPVLIP